jgi:hypothetical protein
VPPAPAAASDQTATELLEHYWASLLRTEPINVLAALPAMSAHSSISRLYPMALTLKRVPHAVGTATPVIQTRTAKNRAPLWPSRRD